MRGWFSRRARLADRDRGSLTLMLIVMAVALIALAGLVIDGGRKLNETETAYAVAQEAARAGADAVNTSQAYSSGTYVVDLPEARAAAQAYLASAGYSGSVSASGNTIQVTVHITESTAVLSIIGIDSMEATGTADASLETGVTGPGS